MSLGPIYDEVSEWYSRKQLGARRLDVLGGTLGSDFYVLEGDSIIERVLDDPTVKLDTEDSSLQLLHLQFILEKFISTCQSRSSNFAIVFFDTNKSLSTRQGLCSDREYARRRLIRAALKAQIECLDLELLTFPDVMSDSWKEFLSTKMPALICTSATDFPGSSSKPPNPKAQDLQYLQMTHLWSLCGTGCPVAALNALEFEESRSSTFLLKAERSLVDAPAPNAPRAIPIIVDIPPLLSTRQEILSRLAQQSVGLFDDSVEDLEALCIKLVEGLRASGDNALNQALLFVWIAHVHLVPHLSPADRSLPPPSLDAQLNHYISNVFYPLLFPLVENSYDESEVVIDIDGFVFCYLLDAILSGSKVADLLGATLAETVAQAWTSSNLSVPDLQTLCSSYKHVGAQSNPPARPSPVVLPFSHSAIDVHTQKVQARSDQGSSVSTKAPVSILLSPFAGVTSQKVKPTHRALARVAPPVDERSRQKKLKRDQRQMAHLTRQAGSLTGVAGALLQQQVIVAAPPGAGKTKNQQAAVTKEKPKGGKVEKAPKLTKAEQIRQANTKQKATAADASADAWWRNQLEEMKKWTIARQQTALDLLFRSPKAQEDWLKAEMSMYKLDLVIRAWMDDDKSDDAIVAESYRLRAVAEIRNIARMAGCTPSMRKNLKTLLKSLGLGELELPEPPKGDAPERTPLFSFTKTWSKSKERAVQAYFPITETPIEFQLRAFGEYMDRSMDSRPDSRTSFDPDAWQATVLDKIDERSSMLVVAPTSAGKTFIGFYAMEKILRESDDGILIYVAPTKALVTQVAAEVYARFKKDRKGGSCWAVHTREVQLNNALETQILVTIPEVLFDMYTNPALAKTWIPRIRYVVFDEIHSIADERGTIWTQLILMTQSPVIGLSATVGDAAGFSKWLESVQTAHGHKHALIVHPHRYSHLRKFVWAGDKAIPPGLRLIHPMAPLKLKNTDLPEDLSLESRDCVTLFRTLVDVAKSTGSSHSFDELEPNTYFKPQSTAFLRQKDVLAYEAALKKRLVSLIRSEDVIERDLGHAVIGALANGVVSVSPKSNPRTDFYLDRHVIGHDLASLLKMLDNQGDLPAILFTFSRNKMDDMAQQLLQSLIAAEDEYRATSPRWKQNLLEWDRWIKSQSKLKDRDGKSSKRKAAGGDDDGGRRKDEERGTAAVEDTSRAPPPGVVDPDEPSPEYSYGVFKRYSRSELDDDLRELSWSNLQSWVIDCLKRGIALHHAGMPKAYRALIETLFRVGYIRVMFSTETLALGINAPARTAVFLGDSKFLTPLLYRQCAGRAGRRGFDLLGKVVFIGVPLDKICRLQLAALPPMTGKYPLSATLALQSLRLLDGSANEDAAKKAVDGLFSSPRLTVDTPIDVYGTSSLLRFNIDFLRRMDLIDEEGTPLTLSPIATGLHEHQPGNLALVALLRGGYFHELCKDFEKSVTKYSVCRTMVLVLAHLFARRPILRFSKDAIAQLKRSPSEVVLPALPPSAKAIIDQYNSLVLDVYTGCSLTYASQFGDKLGKEDSLPLSGEVEVEESAESIPIAQTLKNKAIRSITRSVFVANSGLGDVYSSMDELCCTTRPGIHLEKFMTPYIEIPDEKSPWVLNAAIYDYFIHASQHELNKSNLIGRGQVWYLLNEFAFALEAIQTALEVIFKNALKGSAGDDIAARERADLDDDKDDVKELLSGENAEGVSAAFPQKPKELPQGDWDVYCAFVTVRVDFDEKFRAMWA